jgi:hypothetical protein
MYQDFLIMKVLILELLNNFNYYKFDKELITFLQILHINIVLKRLIYIATTLLSVNSIQLLPPIFFSSQLFEHKNAQV